MLPMFYHQLSALSAEKYDGVSIDQSTGYHFAAESNVIPVSVSEFSLLLAFYPIVFIRNKDGFVPVAVTGCRNNENYFVDKKGGWLAEYLPAYVRRYPFIVADAGDGSNSLTVCIDNGYPGLNREARGELLFCDKQQTPFLQEMTDFLKEFEKDYQRNRLFCKQLESCELLEPSQAHFMPSENGMEERLDGFYVVGRKALNDLDEEQILKLHANGALELIYLHLTSLKRFDSLFKKMAKDC